MLNKSIKEGEGWILITFHIYTVFFSKELKDFLGTI